MSVAVWLPDLEAEPSTPAVSFSPAAGGFVCYPDGAEFYEVRRAGLVVEDAGWLQGPRPAGSRDAPRRWRRLFRAVRPQAPGRADP